jgi:Na+/H+-dicarboxylate symporter
MCRTAVNVFSDTVGAVVIAKSEGETPYSMDPDTAMLD